ncbi:hypothetical protein, partial [Curtobacterium sp. B8]|uniref:hypothetical protein n=1 Tax=Curtobacterium sp. B8 TaxID=95611 RepID=UPI0005B2B7D4
DESPPWLTIADAGRLFQWRTQPVAEAREVPQLFARKFSTDRSSELLDLVDAAFGLRPTRPERVAAEVVPS